MSNIKMAIARMLILVLIPTQTYMIAGMFVDEYSPAIGWGFGILMLILAWGWALPTSELFKK